MLKKPALAEIADLQERGYAELRKRLDGHESLGLAMLNKADANPFELRRGGGGDDCSL